LRRAQRRPSDPPIALDRIRWKGEQCFRILSYYFSVRWNFEAAGDEIMYTLGDFAVANDPEEFAEVWAPGLPPRYSIVRRRPSDTPYYVLYGDGVMTKSDKLDWSLTRLVWHVNAQTIRQTGNFLLIHAGAVSSPAGEGIVLPARSGGGKTTLVTGLMKAGFSYLSDEGAAVDPVSRDLYPYHRALTFKVGHRTVFPDVCARVNGGAWATGQKWINPADIRPDAIGRPCPIRFVVAHEYVPGAQTQLTPLTQAQGAMELLTNALNLPRYRARAVPLVADVVRRAQSYRLVSGDLGEAVGAITELTRRPGRSVTRAG
jgi:hypothetical protein